MGSNNEISSTKGDDWKHLAKHYQKLTTEVAVKPIQVMLQRANALLPFSKATGILDNGCGPGPVMESLLKEYDIPSSCSLTCSDFSASMIENVEKKKEELVQADVKSPWGRVSTVVQDAMDLNSIGDASVSHVTAGWVYFMVSDPQKALSESLRVLQDGGVLTCSSWQGSQWLDMMNLVPNVRPDKEIPRMAKPWTQVDALKAELEKAGFRDVESHQADTTMQVENLEETVVFLIEKLPHMIKLTEDFTPEELARLKELMITEGRKMAGPDPGVLKGVSLVAVGRK